MKNKFAQALKSYVGEPYSYARSVRYDETALSELVIPVLGLLFFLVAWFYDWLPRSYYVSGVIAALMWIGFIIHAQIGKSPLGSDGRTVSPGELDVCLKQALEEFREEVVSGIGPDETIQAVHVFAFVSESIDGVGSIHVSYAPRGDGTGHLVYNPIGLGAVVMTSQQIIYRESVTDYIKGRQIVSRGYDLTWDTVHDVVVGRAFPGTDGSSGAGQLIVELVTGQMNADMTLSGLLNMDELDEIRKELGEEGFAGMAGLLGTPDSAGTAVIAVDVGVWGLPEAPATAISLITDIERHMKKVHGQDFVGVRAADGEVESLLEELREKFGVTGSESATDAGFSGDTTPGGTASHAQEEAGIHSFVNTESSDAPEAETSYSGGTDSSQEHETSCPVCGARFPKPQGTFPRCPHCGAPL